MKVIKNNQTDQNDQKWFNDQNWSNWSKHIQVIKNDKNDWTNDQINDQRVKLIKIDQIDFFLNVLSSH